MSYLDEATIAAIDARIAKARQVQTAKGTVAERDSSGVAALVVFDGTAVPQPVKVLGHVVVDPGDRVVMQMFGSTWVVMGSFARRALAGANRRDFCVSGSASTSSTFVDTPSSTTISGFVKRYDGTDMRLAMGMTTWTSVIDTNVAFGIRIAGTPGTETADTYTANDVEMTRMEYDTEFIRIGPYASARFSGIPAGTYDFTTRWRRISGTGEIRTGAPDQVVLDVAETSPAGAF